MKANLKKVKDCRVRMTVEVEPELVEQRFQEVLKDIQRVAQLPGFRAGKVPLDLVQKRFTKEAEEEVLKSLIPEAYHRSIASQKIEAVTLPSISEIRLERGKGLWFSAEFDRFPEFSLKNYKGLKIRKVSSEIKPEDLEQAMRSLVESRAEMNDVTPPRGVERGDFIVADIEMMKDGRYVPGRKGVLLAVEPNPKDDFFDRILGAQTDEVREVSVEVSDEDKKKGIVGRTPLYKVWVRAVKTKTVPPLDDAMAKSFGRETLEELREAVRKDLAAHKQQDAFRAMKEELCSKLLASVSFPCPDQLVEKQRDRLIQQATRQLERLGVSKKELEGREAEIRQDAEKKAQEQVKLYFILQKISDLEKIELDEAELERRLRAIAEETERPIEEARRVFEEDLRESLRESKTIDFLLAHADLREADAA